MAYNFSLVIILVLETTGTFLLYIGDMEIFTILFVFFFSGLQVQHVEVPRLGVQSELQLPASTTATAMLDPSCICDLHHSSRQCWILLAH